MHLSLGLLSIGEFGGYVAWWKFIPPILVLLLWARALTWADKDTLVARLPREGLNGAMMGGLVLAYAFFFLLPSFWIAFPVLVILFGAEIGVYLSLRNSSIGLQDLKEDFANWRAGKEKGDTSKEAPPAMSR